MGRGGTEPAGEYMCFYIRRNENHKLGTVFFVHKGIVSVVKRVKSVNDRMWYKILRGWRCDMIVLNVYAPTEDSVDDMKDSFYKEVERVFE
jgi:hypothetical protein